MSNEFDPGPFLSRQRDSIERARFLAMRTFPGAAPDVIALATDHLALAEEHADLVRRVAALELAISVAQGAWDGRA